MSKSVHWSFCNKMSDQYTNLVVSRAGRSSRTDLVCFFRNFPCKRLAENPVSDVTRIAVEQLSCAIITLLAVQRLKLRPRKSHPDATASNLSEPPPNKDQKKFTCMCSEHCFSRRVIVRALRPKTPVVVMFFRFSFVATSLSLS